jgi:feruloyl esterase
MFKSLVLAAASIGLASAIYCPDLAAALSFEEVNASVVSTTYHTAGSTIQIEGDQAVTYQNVYPEVDICRVVLTIATSPSSHNYFEVWLPTSSTPWNGRLMGTYNGGLAGVSSSIHDIVTTYV